MNYCIFFSIHTYDLQDFEKMSLNRLYDLYNERGFYIVIPENFDYDYFLKNNLNENIYNKAKKYNLDNHSINYYDNKWFANGHTHSALMLLDSMYQDIKNLGYDYMFIYQTDSYIFYDQLEYWINKQYPYLGAYELLIIDNYDNIFIELDNIYYKKYMFNGGFCLRNVNYILNNINNIPSLKNNIMENYSKYVMSEDQYFSEILYDDKRINEQFIFDSYHFSLSGNYLSKELYLLMDYKYPFGCHGFQRDPFLQNLISKFNKENNISYNIY